MRALRGISKPGAFDHRKPPLPASMLLPAPVAGICRWCAKATDDGSTMHEACEIERAIVMGHRPITLRELRLRDGCYCGCGCGTVLFKPKTHTHRGFTINRSDPEMVSWAKSFAPERPAGTVSYGLVLTPVKWVEAVKVQIEHRTPLWQVAHLPDEERIEYFKLPNLWLWTVDCHKRKTAGEATDRAKQNRVAKAHAEHHARLNSPEKAKRIRARHRQMKRRLAVGGVL